MFNGYLKPGPGVDKDAPKKKGIFLYFEIFFRKFARIVQANMLYIAASLPWIVLLYFFGSIVTYDAAHSLVEGVNMAGDNLSAGEVEGMMQLLLRFLFLIMVITLLGSGPASAGYAYLTRCFTREQHAWIWSDFKDKFKENFKQSMIVVAIDAVVIVLAANAIMFYVGMYTETLEFMWMLVCYILILGLLIFSWAHFYIYQIMVTFKCTFGQLYKNAFIMALGKMPMNLLLTVIMFVVNVLLYGLLNPLIAFIASFVIGYSITRFPVEFYASRSIDKIIDAMPKNPQPKYFDDEEEF